ncbi:DUF2065 domain-containing protein [Thermopetrobacter sp. TC1]|uniref:DUF2065 domain-containing protein n=1 Tax=Thermopetrobacter sp. TC1 TaxID=1495045 RepID=UPI00057098F5|nr:DUF2065 domain-containing protein [Thermopetrobacter sp. TC1]
MLAMAIGGLGFALLFEGILYAAAPQHLKRMAALVAQMDDDTLRAGGLFAVGTGLLVLYIARVIAAG